MEVEEKPDEKSEGLEEGKQEVEEKPEEESSEESQSTEKPGEEESETVVMIGDEEPEEQKEAPPWIKDLRKQNREQKKEIKKLREQVQVSSVKKIDDPGKKPTLEDFEYDPDEFEKSLSAWVDNKKKFEEKVSAQENQQKEEEKSFQAKVTSYQEQKLELELDKEEIEEAEQVVYDLMSTNQIASVVTYSKKPALMFVALGKNPKKAKELSEIKDPIKFAIAVAELEKNVKVTQRKPATAPERTLNGGGPVMSAGDKELERLRKKAEETGDYTEIAAYRNKQKKA